jgi:hypothetical protein
MFKLCTIILLVRIYYKRLVIQGFGYVEKFGVTDPSLQKSDSKRNFTSDFIFRILHGEQIVQSFNRGTSFIHYSNDSLCVVRLF